MPGKMPRDRLCLPYEGIVALLDGLPGEYVAVGLRLVKYQIDHGSGMPADQFTAARLGIHERRWRRASKALEGVFNIVDGHWVLACLKEAEAETTARFDGRRKRARKGWNQRRRDGDVVLTVSNDVECKSESAKVVAIRAEPKPQEPAPAMPPKKLPRKGTQIPLGFDRQAVCQEALDEASEQNRKLLGAAWDMGVKLLQSAGESEAKARSLIGMLMKDWDAGYVVVAIQATVDKGSSVVAPFSWMRKFLGKYPKKSDNVATVRTVPVNGRAQSKFHPIATPKSLGLSQGLTDKILDKNRRTAKGFSVIPEVSAAGGEK